MTESDGPRVDLGDGVTATAAELLERCVQHGGMAAFEDVLDEIILERRGRLSVRRRVRRWLRHTFRNPVGATAEHPPAIEISDPQPVADSADIMYAAWAGEGIVGSTRPGVKPTVLFAWADPGAPARRVVELAGIVTTRLSPSPRGDRVALHLLHDGRPGGGWADDFSGYLIVEVSTGEVRTLLESTTDFELKGPAVWSPDGRTLALGGFDRRAAPPLPTSIRLLDATTARSLASIERPGYIRPLRFEGDAVIVESGGQLYRWQPGTTRLVDEPGTPSRPSYVFASGDPAGAFEEGADGRVLLQHAGRLAWSRRAPVRPGATPGT